ncbi:MAG: alpha/beta fold hydrolase [Myxococcota bacterium]|nr:alpha/beta fold hydrolase [Myxococcota bacterium]
MPRQEERPVAIPRAEADGSALEGLYVAAPDAAAGGAVVAPPHPLYGGSMDSPVVSEVSWACTKAGLASLRFNWRGVGASAGTPSGDPADARADYGAALAQLAESVPGPLVAAGYSFGAAAAAAAAGEARVERLVLVAPPPPMLDADALAAVAGGVLILTGEDDAIAPPAPLAALAESLPRARFVTLAEADHFFLAGLAQLAGEVADWLKDG